MKRLAPLILGFLLLFVSAAYAVSTRYGTIIGTGNTRATLTTTTTSAPYCFAENVSGDLIFWLNVLNNSGTAPTINVVMQYSPDRNQWKSYGTPFAQVTTTAGGAQIQTMHLSNDTHHQMRCVRAVATLAGTNPNYSVLLQAYFK